MTFKESGERAKKDWEYFTKESKLNIFGKIVMFPLMALTIVSFYFIDVIFLKSNKV